MSKENNSVIANQFSKAVNNLKLGFREVPREAVDVLFSKYGGLVFNFIDFNYTNTLDRLCLETSRLVNWGIHNGNRNTLGRIIHVHGTVDKDMILGVSDETQIANLDIFKSVDMYYLAQMIKSQTDSVNEEYTYEKTIHILNSSHFVYVYGMSLGDTDKFWWKQLCELLLKKGEVQVVIHCYDAPKDELHRFEVKRYDKQAKAS